jgi:hypothetical protein
MPCLTLTNMSSFLQKLWNEAEPLIIHTGIILILELAILLVGLVALSLEKLFPNHSWYFNQIERIDILVALGVLCLFGLQTLIRIINRLMVSIVIEVVSSVDIVRESLGKLSRKRDHQQGD